MAKKKTPKKKAAPKAPRAPVAATTSRWYQPMLDNPVLYTAGVVVGAVGTGLVACVLFSGDAPEKVPAPAPAIVSTYNPGKDYTGDKANDQLGLDENGEVIALQLGDKEGKYFRSIGELRKQLDAKHAEQREQLDSRYAESLEQAQVDYANTSKTK